MSSTPEYRITDLTASDFEEWNALFRAYIDFYESSLDDEQYTKTFNRLVNKTNGLGALVMREVSDDKTRIVGFAHFLPMESTWSEKKILFLDDLYVDPSVRRKGLGRKLIQAVADVAKNNGYLRVHWVTKHTNARARALYDTVAKTIFTEYRMELE